MHNVIFTTDTLYEDIILKNCFNEHTHVYTNSDPFVSDIDYMNISNLAFMYHYPGFAQIPFFNDTDIDINNPIKSTYNFFSDKLIDLFKYVKLVNENVVIDLLTCDLNDQSFKDEVALIENNLGINIRYSIDKTGSNPGGNWVLESDNVDVKNIYFNDNIDNWNVILAGAINITPLSAIFEVTVASGVTTIKLLSDITITGHASLSAWGKTDYIELGNNFIFNGNGRTINFGLLTDINGLFSSTATSGTTKPLIHNLGVLGGSTASLAGFIVRSSQKFVAVENCYSTGIMTSFWSGGIMGYNVGQNGGLATATNCYSTGAISGASSGGIMGYFAGSSNGSAIATNCYSTGNISGASSGGIMGQYAGYSNGSATVNNCYSTGIISGVSSGGIMGQYAGSSNGSAIATNCYSTGNISGASSGGIMGSDVGNTFGNATTTNCYSTGNISGNGSGGIIGANAGISNGLVTATNCYSTGLISGVLSGGVIGSNSSSVVPSNCFSANGGTFTTIPSNFLTNLSAIYLSVANSFPILKSFQSLPWITDSGYVKFYDLYTKPAQFNIPSPFVTDPNQFGYIPSSLTTITNWLTNIINTSFSIVSIIGTSATSINVNSTTGDLTFVPSTLGVTTFRLKLNDNTYISPLITITILPTPTFTLSTTTINGSIAYSFITVSSWINNITNAINPSFTIGNINGQSISTPLVTINGNNYDLTFNFLLIGTTTFDLVFMDGAYKKTTPITVIIEDNYRSNTVIVSFIAGVMVYYGIQ